MLVILRVRSNSLKLLILNQFPSLLENETLTKISFSFFG